MIGSTSDCSRRARVEKTLGNGFVVDLYDFLQERLLRCKKDVLEVEYELFLERQKFDHFSDSLRVKKLEFKRDAVYRAYVEAYHSTGKVFGVGLEREVHEYIKSKGHRPRRTFGLVFALALVTTFFASFLVLMFFYRGTAGSLDALVLGVVTAGLFWFWWSKKETF
jgi:hypothetical protein